MQDKRVEMLEAEIQAHNRTALWLFMEFAARRPRERLHLIALLEDTLPQMPPPAAALARTLIDELRDPMSDGTN